MRENLGLHRDDQARMRTEIGAHVPTKIGKNTLGKFRMNHSGKVGTNSRARRRLDNRLEILRRDWLNVCTGTRADGFAHLGTTFWLNCSPNLLPNFSVNFVTNFGPDFLTDFVTNSVTNFGTSRGSNIFRGRLDAESGAGRNMRTNRNGGKRVAQKNLRRSFLVDDGLNRRTDRGTLRQNRRRKRGSREGKMERSRLFRFQRLQFFLLAILARDFAERSSIRSGIRIETRGRIFRSRGRAIFFLCAFVPLRFRYGAVFGSENASAREIVVRVNVSGRFLFLALARAFLTSGAGDALGLLVLRARNRRAEGNAT